MILFYLIIFSIFSLFNCNNNNQQIITIHINEELPLSTILFTTPNNIFYRLFDSGRNQNSFIFYNTTNGQIILIHSLDREYLCSQHICSCLHCQLIIELIEWQKPYRILKLILHIEDINDHQPKFSSDHYQINLMENIPIGFELPLESAYDEDLGENGRISYEFQNSTNEPFQLITKSNGGIILKIIKEIDREKQDFYQYYLIAYDHGQPRRESSTKLFIIIDDMNDNSVQLSQTYLHLHLSENTPIGTELTSINATDADIGINGKIHYSLIHSYSMEYFHLDEYTGILTLINLLDYEIEQSFHLTIQVRDLGENSFAQFIRIDISIIDENDNIPQAFVTFIQPLVNNSIISLVENTPIGQILAHISIYDRDSGINGEMSCEIIQGKKIIGIKYLDERTFLLIIQNSIDRENENHSENQLIIIITDHGKPSKSIQLKYEINIIDINDTPPIFHLTTKQCHRYYYQNENRSLDQPIFQIKAIDYDENENGQISYFILSPYNQTFTINEHGEIYYFNEFNQTFYHLQIMAIDHGEILQLNSTYDCFITILKNTNSQINHSNIRRNSLLIIISILCLILLIIIIYKFIFYPRKYFQPNKTYHLYVSIPRKSSDKDYSHQSSENSRPVSISTCRTSNSMLIQLAEEEKLIS